MVYASEISIYQNHAFTTRLNQFEGVAHFIYDFVVVPSDATDTRVVYEQMRTRIDNGEIRAHLMESLQTLECDDVSQTVIHLGMGDLLEIIKDSDWRSSKRQMVPKTYARIITDGLMEHIESLLDDFRTHMVDTVEDTTIVNDRHALRRFDAIEWAVEEAYRELCDEVYIPQIRSESIVTLDDFVRQELPPVQKDKDGNDLPIEKIMSVVYDNLEIPHDIAWSKVIKGTSHCFIDGFVK